MVNSCVVCSVKYEKGAYITFHRLPNEEKLRQEWIQALNISNMILPKFTYVCSKHFSSTCFIYYPSGKRGIRKGAVPRLYPIPPLSVPVEDEKELLQNQPSTSYEIFHPGSTKEMDVNDSSTTTASESQDLLIPKETIVKKKSSDSSTITATEAGHSFSEPRTPHKKKRKILKPRYYGDISSEATMTPRKAKVKLNLASKRIRLQSKRIRNLQQCNRRLKSRIGCLKTLLKYLKDNQYITENAESTISAALPEEANEILKRFLKGPSKQQYSSTLRSFALTLHFYSAKAYNYVRQKFNNSLPHPRTISKWYHSIDGSPGFTMEAMRALKAKVLIAASKGKQIITNLTIDEMAIKKRIEWDGKKFTGYVDLGTGFNCDSADEAKQALVFMLVAVNDRWKVPIGYFLIDALSGSEKANLLIKALEFVHASRVIVSSTTFDGASSNVKMVTNLGAKFENKDSFQTWIEHPVTKEKTFIFFEACHMLKLLRNCLSDYEELLNSEGKVISWKFIEELVKFQDDEGLLVGTKLRKRHINWSDQPMKVNLAAQTLSRSVADALLSLEHDFKLEQFKNAHATAEFITNINDLFDILNSRNKYCKISLRRAFSNANKTEVFLRLNEIKGYLKGLTTRNGLSVFQCRRKTGFIGFLTCIERLMGMFNIHVVEKKSLDFILSYKFSQDHLELFFSAMRNRLGMNNNPTARQFETSYKRLIIHTEVKASESANAIALDTTSILNCASSNTLTRSNMGENMEESDVYQQISEDSLQHHDYLGSAAWHLTDCTKDIVTYIAGFVVKSLKKCIVCNECMRILEGNVVLSKLQIRKTYGRLQKALNYTVFVCMEGEKTIRYLISQSQLFSQNERKINATILNITRNIPNEVFSVFGDHVLDNDIWSNHSLELTKLILKKYINVRIYHETSKLSDVRTTRKKLTKTILFRNE